MLNVQQEATASFLKEWPVVRREFCGKKPLLPSVRGVLHGVVRVML